MVMYVRGAGTASDTSKENHGIPETGAESGAPEGDYTTYPSGSVRDRNFNHVGSRGDAALLDGEVRGEVNHMKDMMERARKLADAGNDFNDIFCRMCGWLDSKASFKPDETYTVREVGDLFDLLFGIKQSRAVSETR